MTRDPYRLLSWALLASFVWCIAGCRGRVPPDEAAAVGTPVNEQSALDHFPPAELDHFAGMDGTAVEGLDDLAPRISLTQEEIIGRNAWMMWTGGNEAFWDWLSRHGYGTIDLLQLLDSNDKGKRFATAGLVSEPGMRPPTEEETSAAHGVRYDRPIHSDQYKTRQPDPKVYGYSSGIVGLRLFPNPEFKGRAVVQWNGKRYYEDHRYASDPVTIRPFRVGMSCAFCHAAPDPLRPPSDPEFPEWRNLSATIGNQYLRVREVLGNVLEKDNYLYHVIDSQFPGTIDTSLIASDNINNANTMNAVFGLGWRVERSLKNPPEAMGETNEGYPGVWQHKPKGGVYDFDSNPRPVPRVLVDGSDSVGAWLSFARVYLNIGTYHQQWVRVHNPVLGFRKQDPFSLADIEKNSLFWKATKLRVDPTIAFFIKASDPMRLKDAIPTSSLSDKSDRGSRQNHTGTVTLRGEGLPWSPDNKPGREVFAKGCIACHSSFQPGDNNELEKLIELPSDNADKSNRRSLQLNASDLARLARGDGELPVAYAAWATAVVEKKVFWEKNYLSTDTRIPVTLTKTNSGRAVATNAMHGEVWEDFSSTTYKELNAVGPISYFDPFAATEKSYSPPSGGPGYYRVPTLISVWATAPYFHNNSLGKFNNDPSVTGRHAAFQDGIRKLLWPELRQSMVHDRGTVDTSDDVTTTQLQSDHGLVWRTPNTTTLTIYGHQIPSLLAGISGWSDVWVNFVPWVPALLYVGLFLGIVFLDPIVRFRAWLVGLSSNSAPILSFLNIVLSLVLFAIGIGAAWYASRYWTAMQVIETTSSWPIPWVRLQAGVAVLFFFILAGLASYEYLPFRRTLREFRYYVAVLCLLCATFLAVGFGMFASGHGGDFGLGPFPKGMPVNLLSNVDPKAPTKDVKRAMNALLKYFRDSRHVANDKTFGLSEFEKRVAPLFMKISKCPDFALDRGHDFEFIRLLSDKEKENLIELMKTF